MNKDYFYFSLGLSIIIQVLTGIFDIFALSIKVPLAVNIIKQLLILELLVQVIEGTFYFWLLYNFNTITNVTPKRYIDWVITTPTMLVTLIIYLIYLNNKAISNLDFFQVFNDNFNTISHILILNWLMLLFGYLGESKIISTLLGVFLGFIPFLIYYYLIFINYVNFDNSGWKLFFYFFFFWSLYGVAAIFPYYIKNTFYNILDLFAKNFFGIFLAYVIITQSY
jgi:bacteriorhodopsin